MTVDVDDDGKQRTTDNDDDERQTQSYKKNSLDPLGSVSDKRKEKKSIGVYKTAICLKHNKVRSFGGFQNPVRQRLSFKYILSKTTNYTTDNKRNGK